MTAPVSRQRWVMNVYLARFMTRRNIWPRTCEHVPPVAQLNISHESPARTAWARASRMSIRDQLYRRWHTIGPIRQWYVSTIEDVVVLFRPRLSSGRC
jgi:hypothetical protein